MNFKLIFFTYFFSMGAYVPFLALYLERAGLPGTQIGIVLAISPLLRLFVTPLWGMLADTKNWHRRIYVFCALGTACAAPFYIFSSTILAFIVVQIIFISLRSPLGSIANKLMMEVQRKGKLDYGKTRIYGSIGFAIMAIMGGRIAETYGLYILFYFLTGGFLTLSLLGTTLPDSSEPVSNKIIGDIGKLLKNKTLVIFLITATLVRTAAIAPTSYLSILMDHLGAGESFTGISWAGTALIEIIFYFISARVIKKYGLKHVLFYGYLVVFLQILLYNFAYTPFVLIFAQIARGIGFSICLVTGINFVEEQTPAEVKTTGQSLFTAANFGLSAFLGNLIGGALYDYFGLYSIYRFAAVCVCLGIVIFYFSILKGMKKRKTG